MNVDLAHFDYMQIVEVPAFKINIFCRSEVRETERERVSE